MKFLKQISLNEWLSTLIIASATFLLLGTITALWNNSFFIRMTEVNGWDYIIQPNRDLSAHNRANFYS